MNPSRDSHPQEGDATPISGSRILVVDDHDALRELIRKYLVARGAEAVTVGTATEALQQLADEPAVDLVLLDIEMPDRSGWEFLDQIRSGGDDTPVIFLTATSDVESRVRGLEQGADDFIVKPFHEAELLARIEAVLRRRQAMPLLQHGHVRLDAARRVAWISGREVELTPREIDLLRVLVEARGHIVSRTELLERVWNMKFEPGTTVVEVQIARLRRKIDVTGPPLIENVAGEGYRMREPGS